MKKLFLLLFSVIAISAINNKTFAQETKATAEIAAVPPHKIIFQLNSGDTLSHKQLMKQISNILTVAPGTKVEIVCHGPGLDMLMKEKTTVSDKITEHTKAGVLFVACEFAMKDRKVEKSQILADAGYVKAGIIEIVSKQEQGWSYIKAGF